MKKGKLIEIRSVPSGDHLPSDLVDDSCGSVHIIVLGDADVDVDHAFPWAIRPTEYIRQERSIS